MNKEELIKTIEDEQKIANGHYKYHCSQEKDYNLRYWFNGQRAILRKLKAIAKKL